MKYVFLLSLILVSTACSQPNEGCNAECISSLSSPEAYETYCNQPAPPSCEAIGSDCNTCITTSGQELVYCGQQPVPQNCVVEGEPATDPQGPVGTPPRAGLTLTLVNITDGKRFCHMKAKVKDVYGVITEGTPVYRVFLPGEGVTLSDFIGGPSSVVFQMTAACWVGNESNQSEAKYLTYMMRTSDPLTTRTFIYDEADPTRPISFY